MTPQDVAEAYKSFLSTVGPDGALTLAAAMLAADAQVQIARIHAATAERVAKINHGYTEIL